jgi:ParB family chromosome partitioning protein
LIRETLRYKRIDPKDAKTTVKAWLDTAPNEGRRSDHSKAFFAELTARKSTALRYELAKTPDLPLGVSAHSVAIKVLCKHQEHGLMARV